MSAAAQAGGRTLPLGRALALTGALLSVLAATLLFAQGSFAAHMGAHLLLGLITPPLLLAGLDWWPPVPAWLGFAALNLVTFGVHLPGLNGELMMRPPLRVPEAAAFLGSGLLFWAGVNAARRGTGWKAVGWLVAQMAACAVLGAAIAFSRGVYMGQAGGLSAGDDVALGGVMMWVLGGGVYMVWGMVLTMKALNAPELPGTRAGAAAPGRGRA